MLASIPEIAPGDRAHICLDSPAELAFWRQELRVDECSLRSAIQAVGFNVKDVRDYLATRRPG